MDYAQKARSGLTFVLDLMSPSSPFGKEKLKNLEMYKYFESTALRRELDNVEKAVNKLKNCPSFFDILKHTFSQVKDIRGSILRLKEGKVLDEVELFEIRRFSELSAQIKDEFDRITGTVNLAGISFSALCPVAALLSPQSGGGFMISSEYSEKLKFIRQKKAEINKKLALAENSEDKKRFTDEHFELAVKEQAEEAEVRKILSKKLIPYAAEIEDNIKNIATLDLIIEKARIAIEHSCVKPEIGTTLEFIDMVNPMSDNILRRNCGTFTPLTISANNGVTVITGANMGGKTTILKTIALNAFLALCGFFAFAKKACVPLFDFIDIVSDNLQSDNRGLSSFGGEILKVDSLFKRTSAEYGLILLDEFGAGTNADEGVKIFRALCKAFNKRKCVVFMTTHYDNAADFAVSHYQVTGLRYADFNSIKRRLAEYKDSKIIAEYMDYSLIKTNTDTKIPKDAIRLSQMLGLDSEILKELLEE